MSAPPSPGNKTRPGAIVSVLLLVLATALVPVVFIAGFAWPIYESLFCESSCNHSRLGSVVIWALGAALVGGLAFAGIRGIVSGPGPSQPPRPDE